MSPSPLIFHLDSSIDAVRNEVRYTLSVLAKNLGTGIDFVGVETDGAIRISASSDADITLNLRNVTHVAQLRFDQDFTADAYLKLENGRADHLSTAFYLLSLAQELDDTKRDRFGRFPYSESYQKHFKLTTENRVQHCFDAIIRSSPRLNGFRKTSERSRIFISHDVDFINGALMRDGLYAIRRLDIPALFRIMFSNLLVNPQWLNMDRIMRIESEYDFRSTFYWLVNKGLSKEGIKNADYDFNSKRVLEQVKLVTSKGWENGLHKSAADDDFQTEIGKLSFTPAGNRYHFLKFRPHNDFAMIDAAGLKYDTSLGFAEEIGFRNSYGLPYRPYDFKTGEAFDFVECPLHIMDTTFHYYQKLPTKEAYARIVSFVETNSENAVLSVLWHNNYFTPYKFGEYLDLYKKILLYFKENDFHCITQSQIIEQYS